MELPNFKALGIEKPMKEEISIPKSDLSMLINSSYFNSPLITNRPKDGKFCTIEVINDTHGFWYKDLIGFTFFCQIIFGNYGYGEFIQDFKGVKLTANKMIVFRSFNPEDVIII